MATESPPPPTPPPGAPAPGGTPPGTPTPKPRGKQLAILLIRGAPPASRACAASLCVGPLLAFGGCALFLSTMSFNSGAAGAGGIVFGLLFCVGLGMFLIGCVIA